MKQLSRGFGLATLLAISLLVSRLQAGDEPSRYWIGIVPVDVSEDLRSHLKIEGGVVIQDIVKGAAADKAGIRKHDIIVSLGDKKISSTADIFTAVADSKGKTLTVVLIREGESQQSEMVPELRSDYRPSTVVDPRKQSLRWTDSKHPAFVRMLAKNGEGVADGEFLLLLDSDRIHKAFKNSLPTDLSITIKKTGDKPAQIEVRQDKKTYKCNENELNKLPADVRPHVNRFLGHGRPATPAIFPRHRMRLDLNKAPEIKRQSRVEEIEKEIKEVESQLRLFQQLRESVKDTQKKSK